MVVACALSRPMVVDRSNLRRLDTIFAWMALPVASNKDETQPELDIETFEHDTFFFAQN